MISTHGSRQETHAPCAPSVAHRNRSVAPLEQMPLTPATERTRSCSRQRLRRMGRSRHTDDAVEAQPSADVAPRHPFVSHEHESRKMPLHEIGQCASATAGKKPIIRNLCHPHIDDPVPLLARHISRAFGRRLACTRFAREAGIHGSRRGSRVTSEIRRSLIGLMFPIDPHR